MKLFLKSDSFYDEMYPALSDAIKHFKDSEKGREEVCKSIEAYAENRAVDTAIEVCIEHNDSLEETIKIVTKKFKEVTKDYISSKFESLLSASSAK